MRLIDADAAIDGLFTELFLGIPTVDAVPVEWLKEKLTGHPELSYTMTDAIQNVLDLWEVEHETN